jgi:prepilin-type N-terminal cleavage/methylation domain-containing protein
MTDTVRMKTKHTSPLPSRAAFTLIEMLVVIAIIALLVALSVPAINRGVDNARRSQSMSNQRQTGQAFIMYATDQGNRRNLLPPVLEENVTGFPYGRPWFIAISPYLERQATGAGDLESVYRCPVFAREYQKASSSDWSQLGYGMSYRLVGSAATGWTVGGTPVNTAYSASLSDIRNPSSTVLLADEQSWNWGVHAGNYEHALNAPDGYFSPSHGRLRGLRHRRGALFLTVDGSVHFLTPEALEPFLR